MTFKSKVQASAPAVKKKSTVHDPVAISKRINYPNNHFIIYPTTSGYRFMLLCRLEKTDPFEVLAVSNKAYKLKSDGIRAMKIIIHALGGSSMSDRYILAYDHKGQKISLKIEYDIKMLL